MTTDFACGRARRLLWPDAGPRPATPEIADARAHVETCAACQRFFDEMGRLATVVRGGAPRPVAPIEVRDRLFRTLARERAGGMGLRRGEMSRVGAAAGVLLLLAVAAYYVTRGRDDPTEIVGTLVEDHTTAMTGERLITSDRDSVLRWLSAHISSAVDVPVLSGTRLRGARLTVIDGRRGAVVEYETGGIPVSYYLVPVEERRGPYAAFAALRRGVAAGYPVVFWRSPAAVHAFVGNVPVAVLERFARECMEQASTA
jgi:anti-sigma factor RsiW